MATPLTSADALALRIDRITQSVALIGFSGLVLMALLTFYDGAARTMFWPRLSGFNDYGELAYPIVIASCFPAVLLRQTNVTVKVLGKVVGTRGAMVLEFFAALVTLIFFSLLAWQLIRLTGNYFASGRTTRTVEMALGPWWLITATIMAICVPVQAYVTWSWFWAALRCEKPAIEQLGDHHETQVDTI